MGVVQIVVNFAFYLVLVGLFVWFERAAAEEVGAKDIGDDAESTSIASSSGPGKDTDDDAIPMDPVTLRAAAASATRLVHISMTFALFIFALCLLTLLYFPLSASLLANILGLAQMALSLVMWLPQIFMTYSLGSLGALSATSLWLATPGTFAMLFSLWSRLGWKGWSAWIVVAVIGTAQVVLLGMSVVFWVRRGKDRADNVVMAQEEDVVNVNETTALLKGRSAVVERAVART